MCHNDLSEKIQKELISDSEIPGKVKKMKGNKEMSACFFLP